MTYGDLHEARSYGNACDAQTLYHTLEEEVARAEAAVVRLKQAAKDQHRVAQEMKIDYLTRYPVASERLGTP